MTTMVDITRFGIWNETSDPFWPGVAVNAIVPCVADSSAVNAVTDRTFLDGTWTVTPTPETAVTLSSNDEMR
jgi:hypothetical protein